MNRQALVGGAVVGALALGALLIWQSNRRQERELRTPDWTQPLQPAEDVAHELTAVDADASWAANRCAPMAACCTGQGAGTRTLRLYAGTLAQLDSSLIRGGFNIYGGC